MKYVAIIRWPAWKVQTTNPIRKNSASQAAKMILCLICRFMKAPSTSGDQIEQREKINPDDVN